MTKAPGSRGGGSQARVYPSKIDAWLVVVLGAAAAFPLVLGAQLVFVSKAAAVGCLASSAFVLLVLAVAVVPCRYTLEDDHLLVQAGLLRWKVPYKDVTAVEPTTNPLSSPALSLERVRIDYAGRSIMVSPVERAEFIQALRAAASAPSR